MPSLRNEGMNMKQPIRLLAVLLLLTLAVLSLSSCHLSEQGEQAKALCEQMTDAILDGQFDAAYALVAEVCTEEAFREEYARFSSMLEGIDSYELQQTAFRSEMKNGVESYEATYAILCENVEDLAIDVAVEEGVEGLTKYRVSQSAAVGYTGSLTTMEGATLPQWALVIYSALCIAFVVLMVLDCVRRTINGKGLWVILILIGHLTLNVSNTAAKLSTGFRIGAFLPYSRLLLYQSGTFDLSLILPIGAVVYFFLRKRLTERYEKPLPPPEE